MVSKRAEIEAHDADFYSQLFMAQELTRPEVITEVIPEKVTVLMNENLTRPYTET